MIADVLRYALAVLGLALAMTSAGGGVLATTWDQRSRFAVMFGYSAITISGQLANLGAPATWRTWALVPITVLAVISTAAFLVRHVRQTRGGPDDGRSRRNQRRVLRAGAPLRRAGHAGNSAEPESGSRAP